MSHNNHIPAEFLFLKLTSGNPYQYPLYERLLFAIGVLILGLFAAAMIGPRKAVLVLAVDQSENPVHVTGELVSVPLDYKPSALIPSNNRLTQKYLSGGNQNKPYRVDKIIQTEFPHNPMGKQYPAGKNPDLDRNPTRSDIPQTEAEIMQKGPIRHRTVNGDTLERLADYYLRDPGRWEEIYLLNSTVLRNKDSVPIGIILLIPKE